MTEYIDGFLLPTLHKLKRENKLTYVQDESIKIKGVLWLYTGDFMDGVATGWGVATDLWGGLPLVGTFHNGKPEGIVIFDNTKGRDAFLTIS